MPSDVVEPAERRQQPAVLAPVEPGPRARAVQFRVRGALLFVPVAAVVATAAWLTPRAAGYGTHQQLGLPPCSFLARTGYPCPSCGLTTSFAAMAHGRLAEAFGDQPFGPALFLAVAAVGLCGLAELLAGRDVLGLLRPGAWWAVATFAGLLAGWGLKIAFGLADGSLPVR